MVRLFHTILPPNSFESALTVKTHYTNVATTTCHRLLKLKSIYSSTFGPSPTTLICLYKSYIRSLFDYGATVKWLASSNVRYQWERIQRQSCEYFPSHHISATTEISSMLTFHHSMTETCTFQPTGTWARYKTTASCVKIRVCTGKGNFKPLELISI